MCSSTMGRLCLPTCASRCAESLPDILSRASRTSAIHADRGADIGQALRGTTQSRNRPCAFQIMLQVSDQVPGTAADNEKYLHLQAGAQAFTSTAVLTPTLFLQADSYLGIEAGIRLHVSAAFAMSEVQLCWARLTHRRTRPCTRSE